MNNLSNNETMSWPDIEAQLEAAVTIDGGFSAAYKGLVTLTNGREVFIKAATDERTHAWIRKEIAAYAILRTHSYPHIPDFIATRPDQTAFALQGLTTQTEWRWPDTWDEDRLAGTIEAMDRLGTISLSADEAALLGERSQGAHNDGWRQLAASTELQANLLHGLHEHDADDLIPVLNFARIAERSSTYRFTDITLVHYDVRSYNSAWNGHDTKLVDMDFLQIGDKQAAETATLAHAQASGNVDVAQQYTDRLDPLALLWRAGYWWANAVKPGRHPTDRDLKLRSGIAAMQLKNTVDTLLV